MNSNRSVIAVVEDHPLFCESVVRKLQERNHDVRAFDCVEDARQGIDEDVDLVILDLRLPLKRGQKAPEIRSHETPLGTQLLRDLKEQYRELDVVVCTGEVTHTQPIIDIMKMGAADYFIKDQEILDRLVKAVETLLEKRRLSEQLSRERRFYKQREQDTVQFHAPSLEGKYHFSCLLGESPAMQRLYATMDRICSRSPESTILITGETGTGKELVAWALHAFGARRDRVYVPVSVPSLHGDTIESELFGYVKGAFTDARSDRPGLFEQANGGTLFLDEIGDIPENVQVDLLRVLQEKTIRKMGATKEQQVDVRFLAATNRNLEEKVRAGEFREDLFYRVNVIHVQLPPLRDRLEDLELLATHFLEKFAAQNKIAGNLTLAPDAIEFLRSFPWVGNVRQLGNVLYGIAFMADGPVVTRAEVETVLRRETSTLQLPDSRLLVSQPLPTLEEALRAEQKREFLQIASDDLKGQVFTRLFVRNKGNLSQVMVDLKISRSTTYDCFERLTREFILKKMCETRGNFQNLAKLWDVPFPDLVDAVAREKRILEYAQETLARMDNDAERVAASLGVHLGDFKETLSVLETLMTWH